MRSHEHFQLKDDTAKNSDDTELLTAEEVAAILKVPQSWVYLHTRRRSKSILPHIKVGKYLRFFESDVHEFLDRLKRR